MQITEFQNMITRIYALFGKTRPGNEIMNGIFESVKYIPESAIDGIIERFEDLPELKSGVNIAKLIRSFYTKPENTQKFYCQYCNNKGYFWGIQQLLDGSFSDFISPCPNCTSEKNNPTYTQLVRRGAMVMPPNYKYGLHRWAMETYGIELHKKNQTLKTRQGENVF